MSQKADILEFLQHRPMTARDAMVHLNCYRLAARILELRQEGHEIHTEMEPHEGGEHARYILHP